MFNGKKNGQDLKLRFFGPVLVETIFRKHFEGIKSRGRKNQEVWIASFSGPFFCLTATVLHHLLRCFRSGTNEKPVDFNMANSSVQSKLSIPDGKVNIAESKRCLQTVL